MRVTPQLLLELGAKPQDDDSYQLTMRGYSFRFVFDTNGSVLRMNGHSITDLEECFGIIAQDSFCAGIFHAKQELKNWLG